MESEFDFHSIISFKRSIEQLLNSSDISFVSSSREILEIAYNEVDSLHKLAERTLWPWSWWTNRTRIEVTKMRKYITEGLSQLEEGILSYVSNQIDLQSESSGDGIQFPSLLPINLQDVTKNFQNFSIWVEGMEQKIRALYYRLPEEEEEDDEDDVVSSTIGSGGHKSKVVGLSNQCNHLKEKLITDEPNKFKVISLVGMPGIGKTTLAKEIYEDPDIMEHFDCRVWVTLGRKCRSEEIPQRVLAQLDPDNSQMLAERDEDDIAWHLTATLKGKRYLIVLDDVWSKYVAFHFQSSYSHESYVDYFPDEGNGSRVLLTTRLQQVNDYNSQPYEVLTLQLLNKEESWDLLREKVFAEELCPTQLEKVGKKIAEQCDGLPLTIVAVANQLSKVEKALNYWSEVATQKNHELFMAAYDEISKVLLRSYKFLPQILQMCFLYMGVFPQNYEIARSKLIRMWYVDGFPELKVKKLYYPDEKECLAELVFNSLIMTSSIIADPTLALDPDQVKTCHLHSSLWHLSNREARKINFSHVLNCRSDGLVESIKSQRRLSFQNNILFAIKEVYESVEENCGSTGHSLLCYGPFHRYQVPICFGLGSLKQLDALTIRFYEFPVEVLQLVRLRYLALTLNGKLPASISKLSKLEFLIVHRYPNIKSSGDSSYLPEQIWNMKQLQLLKVMGSDLSNPNGASLERLLTLSNVSAHCCKSIHKGLPNLKKLGIQIELTPDDDGTALNCFDHISFLNRLTSLKCFIVNPEVARPLAPISILPDLLKKLSLSGLGYPWKEMSKIALLPFLKVLKLRNYAFRGLKWEVEENGFPSLNSLVIEDTDLVEWRIGHKGLLMLKYLSIKHCYKLEKIHTSSQMKYLKNIELVDCNPSNVEQMKKEVLNKAKVSVFSTV